MADVRPAESPDGADNIGLSPVGNTATAPSTKRGQDCKDERTDFEVGPVLAAARSDSGTVLLLWPVQGSASTACGSCQWWQGFQLASFAHNARAVVGGRSLAADAVVGSSTDATAMRLH
jgi:hypothetical protein